MLFHIVINMVEQWFEKRAIERMDWPAYLADFNPIKHNLDALGRCNAAQLVPV